MRILNFFEMAEEDRPSEEIWADEEALSAHFDAVRDRHKSGRNTEAVPAAQNELTKHVKRR